MLQGMDLNFYQTHKSTPIEFHPGMNVITGISSHGKTAIIRGMIWGLNGRPLGDSFKSWFATDKDNVEVSMEFDNGWFTKTRIKDKNQYTCDAGKFEALRADVPEVIQQITNMADYNIMTQHEPFFMLQMSPGDRAKKLNDLVGLSIMDTVIKKLNSKVSKTKSSIVEITGTINKLTDELNDLKYLDVVVPQIQKLDDAISQYEVTSLRRDLMLSLHNKLQEIAAQIKSYDKVLSLESKYQELVKKIKEYQEQNVKYNQLFSIKDQLIEIENSIVGYHKYLTFEKPYLILKDKVNTFQIKETEVIELRGTCKTLKGITDDLKADLEWLSVEEPYNKLLVKIETYNKLQTSRYQLTLHLGNLGGLISRIKDEKLLLDSSIIQYVALLEKSGTCPTCTHKIDVKTVKQIKDKLWEI